MPLSRIPCLGWISEKTSNCERISGEALNSNQLLPSLLTAMDDCVRRLAFISPERTRLQLWQLQFH